MNIDDIITRREQLDYDLRIALATMERKDTIRDIKLQILRNQQACPHHSPQYNWEVVNDTCPYCGKHFSSGGNI